MKVRASPPMADSFFGRCPPQAGLRLPNKGLIEFVFGYNAASLTLALFDPGAGVRVHCRAFFNW